MLRFLTDFDSGLAWTTYGGKETMLSYGVTPPRDKNDLDGWRMAQQALKAAIPESHMRFLWGLEDRVEVGDYLFVHAGVRPDCPLTPRPLMICAGFANRSYRTAGDWRKSSFTATPPRQNPSPTNGVSVSTPGPIIPAC